MNFEYFFVVSNNPPTSHRPAKRLGQHLIDLGFVSEYQMLEALSDKLAEPLIELSEIKVDIDAVQKIPRAMADKYNIIAIDLTDQQLTIVTSDPLNFYEFFIYITNVSQELLELL